MSRASARALLTVVGALANALAEAGAGAWTTDGPGSVTSAGVIADARVPGTIYVGTSGGVARSTDGGRTWSPTTLLTGEPLAAAGGVVYASVITAVGPPLIGGFDNVIYKSPDGGVHWQALVDVGHVNSAIWIDPVTPTTLYRSDTTGVAPPVHLPDFAGLFRSTDGGTTWARIDQGLVANPITALAVDPHSHDTLYLANARPFDVSRLYKSADAGSTWTLLSTGIGASSLVPDPNAMGTVYVAAGGIAVSTDGGLTFRSLAAPPGVFTLVIDPTSSSRLYAAANPTGIFGSSDAGANWGPMNQGLPGPSPPVEGLAIDAAGDALYTIVNGTVWHLEIEPASLVLDAAHPFTITLTATDQRTGRNGAGVAHEVNDLWGYFSIPAITGNPNNPEVFVKMLDGTELNGSYWFFYGGLTDLEYTLTVTEDATGRQKTYTKPAGSECGGSDTAAFTP